MNYDKIFSDKIYYFSIFKNGMSNQGCFLSYSYEIKNISKIMTNIFLQYFTARIGLQKLFNDFISKTYCEVLIIKIEKLV